MVVPSVKVDMVMTLACPLFGFPSPAISWSYPNGSMKMNRFTIILHVLVEKESDIGTYYRSGCGKKFAFELKPSIPSTVPPV